MLGMKTPEYAWIGSDSTANGGTILPEIVDYCIILTSRKVNSQ
jgi:hypothetical protein